MKAGKNNMECIDRIHIYKRHRFKESLTFLNEFKCRNKNNLSTKDIIAIERLQAFILHLKIQLTTERNIEKCQKIQNPVPQQPLKLVLKI